MQIRSTYSGSGITYLTLTSSLGDTYNKTSGNAFLSFSGSNLTTPTSSGSIGIYISAATSSLLNFDTAYYDLEMVSGNEVTRLLEGQVKLSKNVTR